MNSALTNLNYAFKAAEPFPHLVFDELLREDVARAISEEFPTFGEAVALGATVFNTPPFEKNKLQLSHVNRFPQKIHSLAVSLISGTFLDRLCQISGLPLIKVDPNYIGGGIHLMKRGSRLDVHVDFNRLYSWHRRLNLIIYFNQDWSHEWGGQTELWSSKNGILDKCEKRVEPKLGSALLFETSDRSFHGVTPLTCPEGIERRTFSLYLYTLEAPPEYDRQHSTMFQKRPGE
jgi:hypothetical protein